MNRNQDNFRAVSCLPLNWSLFCKFWFDQDSKYSGNSHKNEPVIPACHWHVDVEPYYESCVYDMCACQGDASRCLCPILGDYAMTCAKTAVMIQWRYNVKECGEYLTTSVAWWECLTETSMNMKSWRDSCFHDLSFLSGYCGTCIVGCLFVYYTATL